MFTRCPACHTVHPLNAALLSRGNGRYRCAKCNASANALESLFDSWPESGEKPPVAGDLPVLGGPIDLEQARKSRLEPEESALTGTGADQDDSAVDPTQQSLRIILTIAATAVIAVALILFAEFREQPVAEQAIVRPVLETLGLKDEQPIEVFRDLSQVHLVSRELISADPDSGMLRLNATIVNRANLRQPFPVLEVTLLDTYGVSLGNHRFQPAEYLADKARAGKGMTPHAFLPLMLEIADPGVDAVGFELQFH